MDWQYSQVTWLVTGTDYSLYVSHVNNTYSRFFIFCISLTILFFLDRRGIVVAHGFPVTWLDLMSLDLSIRLFCRSIQHLHTPFFFNAEGFFIFIFFKEGYILLQVWAVTFNPPTQIWWLCLIPWPKFGWQRLTPPARMVERFSLAGGHVDPQRL